MRTTYFQAPLWATGMLLISAVMAQTTPPAEAPPRPPAVPEMLSPAVTGQFQPLAPAAPPTAPPGINANPSSANPAAGTPGGGTVPGTSLTTAPTQAQAPVAPPPLPEGCRPVTERAMSIEAQTLTAIAQQKPLAEQSVLVEEAIALWTKAGAQCEGRLQDRAKRNLQENLRLQQRLKEQSASGPKCEPAHRDAASIQDLAAKALDEGRFPEATRLFQKAEDAWDHAAESCTGTQHDVALKRREQSEIDGHNAEFCAPAFETAREQHQKLANLPASVPRPERQELSQTAETLWRDAMKLCKGEVIEAAKRNAQNIARERNTPWVPRSQIPAATLASIEKRNSPPALPAAATSSASASKALAAAPSATGNPGAKLATGTPDATKANPAATPGTAGAVTGTLTSALSTLGSAVSTLGTTALNANKASAAAAAAAAAAPPTDINSGTKVKTPEQQPPEFTSANASFKGNFVRDAEGNSFSGVGKVTWTNGDVFDGTLDKGLRQGKGRFVWANGQSFDGDWVQDTPNGKGTLKFANGNVFEGDVVAGVPQGSGRMQYVSGDSYQGAITAGVPNGKGIYTWKNGQVFEGDWKAERPNGQGRLKFANGNVFEGTVVDGVPHGNGKLVFAAGDTYVGDVRAGQPDGTGTFNWANGDQYVGQWKDGKKHGQGVFTWKTGDRWEGVFENDVQR